MYISIILNCTSDRRTASEDKGRFVCYVSKIASRHKTTWVEVTKTLAGKPARDTAVQLGAKYIS